MDEFEHYPRYYKLESYTAFLQPETELPCSVSLQITYPDGKTHGVHTKKANTFNYVFNLENYTLFQTGIYKARIETPKYVKYQYFFVGSIDPKLEFVVNRFTTKDNEMVLEFMNDGKIDGFCHTTLYSINKTVENGKLCFNEPILEDVVFIRNGHLYNQTMILSNEDLVLILNDKCYRSD